MRRLIVPLLLLSVPLLVDCGNDEDDISAVGPGGTLVGGPCKGHDDCDERCVKGGEWPDGMCTVSCDRDADCPSATACIEDDGGICAITCTVDDHCRDFGSEWKCTDRKRRGHAGEVGVCRG